MILNMHSYYSLRYGTLSIDELIAGMQAGGYDTAVLTDINNSTGAFEFIQKCRQKGLNGLVGMEFRNHDDCLFVGIAKNETGFEELNAFRTHYNKTAASLPTTAPSFQHVFVVYPYGSRKEEELKENEYLGVSPRQLTKIALHPRKLYRHYVIWSTVTVQDARGYALHKQLRAIDKGMLYSQLRIEHLASQGEVFYPKAQLMKQFQDFPELIRNTNRLLQDCVFDFDFTTVKNKQTFTGNHYNDKQLLHQYCMDGFQRRYGKKNLEAKKRVLAELEIINKLNFSSYFLITDDICRYARSRDFYYVGRGSGANSIVAYCLGITNVCPIELDLYFERFLNPQRKTPPDFDVDFSWDEREEMYQYIFTRYQTDHTALMGAMSTFRSRSIIRELGKVYGLPKADIDCLVHEPEHVLNKNEVTRLIMSVYNQVVDFPNQRTIHASGVLISEHPVTRYSALDYPPKGFPTVQFDMYVAEDIGFEKFDILSQRGLGHIKDCRELVLKNRGVSVDTEDPKRFFKDPRVAEQLRSANTIGCFYVESPAMRQLLTKLKCADYLTLVAASSIVRPGVASSGMMRTFIERYRREKPVDYLHPVLQEQLKETFGVMVYQEDVMKVGHYFGGLSLADADVLRRMMSGKYRSKNHLEEIKDLFFNNTLAKGYDQKVVGEVWRQMESFASYSFSKAHSASFAVESYQSLYLKTYYPLEFMVSVLNNYGGFYQRKVYVNEAKVAGAKVELPCVNRAEYRAVIEGTTIYLGFDGIRSFEQKWVEALVEERNLAGPYLSLEDFIERVGMSLEQVVLLIRCGAFRFTGKNKPELLWQAHRLLKKKVSVPSLSLFETRIDPVLELPELESSLLSDLYDELELLGYPVSGSMFDLAKSDFTGEVVAKDLGKKQGQVIRMVGDWVAEKTVRTKNGSLMKFGTFLDVKGDFFDTVHFPPSLSAYPLRGEGLYLIQGKVVMDFDCPSIEVQKCAKMPIKSDPRAD